MTRIVHLAASLMILAAATFGGEGCLRGTDCSNCCPLAKTANTRLATGHEAVSLSKLVRADIVKSVLANLETI